MIFTHMEVFRGYNVFSLLSRLSGDIEVSVHHHRFVLCWLICSFGQAIKRIEMDTYSQLHLHARNDSHNPGSVHRAATLCWKFLVLPHDRVWSVARPDAALCRCACVIFRGNLQVNKRRLIDRHRSSSLARIILVIRAASTLR